MRIGPIEIADSEFTLRFARSGGPGGQNVNKVNSRVQLSWNVAASAALPPEVKQRLLQQQAARINAAGELLLDCDETSSQHKNRELCFARLRELLLQALKAPRKRVATKPTKASKLRRKRQRAVRKARIANRRVSWDE